MYIHAWHDLTVYNDLLRSCLKMPYPCVVIYDVILFNFSAIQ